MIVKAETFIKEPVISATIITYNHEKYISQSIESILSQKCSVPYELIIADDCSTDGTRDILLEYQKKYPETICLLLQDNNKGLLGNYSDTMRMCRGKYVTGTAGDDYWCDDLKMQKQYDCLESREGYGFVRTAGWVLNEDGKLTVNSHGEQSLEGDVRSLTNHGSIGIASSFFFERQLLQYLDFDEWIRRGFTMEDFPQNAIFGHHTKFAYIPDKCVVYRILSTSISNTKSFDKQVAFKLGKLKIQEYLKELYPEEFATIIPDGAIEDSRNYIQLRNAIFHFKYKEAMAHKKAIKNLPDKFYYKHLNSYVSFLVLYVLIHWKEHE